MNRTIEKAPRQYVDDQQMSQLLMIGHGIAERHGEPIVPRHQDGPFWVSVMIRDSHMWFEVTKRNHPFMLSVTAFGAGGVYEGDIGLLPEVIEHFNRKNAA